jgi:DNA repair protein RadA/Sms
MKKKTESYICNKCANESLKWLGQCPQCFGWNTFEQVNIPAGLESIGGGDYKSVKFSEAINIQSRPRIDTKISELNRVLGGGIVEASVILISGEPGIGKSTLLFQVITNISLQNIRSAYISAEESVDQVVLRGKRLVGHDTDIGELQIVNATEVNTIIKELENGEYKFAIIDSIQTIYSSDTNGIPGGISQIKSVTSKLVSFAKAKGISLVIVGQVTKQGDVAGPKLLEHLVDTVVHLEGDEKRGVRILRSSKNRYGSINEIGIFEMKSDGMHEIIDPSGYFHKFDSVEQIGVCPVAIIEGNRVLILELQALVVSTPFSLPKRISEGISKSKLEVLTAIINKYTKVKTIDKDIYINVTGGIKIKDPAVDLAIILAIMSSALNKPIPNKLVAFGEVALSGDIRGSSRDDIRKSEIQRLGYKAHYDYIKKINTVRDIINIL